MDTSINELKQNIQMDTLINELEQKKILNFNENIAEKYLPIIRELKNKYDAYSIDMLKKEIYRYYDVSQSKSGIVLSEYYNFVMNKMNCNTVILGFKLLEHKVLISKFIYLLNEFGKLQINLNNRLFVRFYTFILILLIFEVQSRECLKLLVNKMYTNMREITMIMNSPKLNKLNAFIILYLTIYKLYNNIMNEYKPKLDEFLKGNFMLEFIFNKLENIENIQIGISSDFTKQNLCKLLKDNNLNHKIIKEDFEHFIMKNNDNSVTYKLLTDNNILNIYVYMMSYIQMLFNICN